jgi:hypothetical protein
MLATSRLKTSCVLPAAATVFASADETASHRTYLSPVGRLLLPAVALVYGQTALLKVDPKQENGGAHYVVKPGFKPPYKVSTSMLGLLSHKVRTVAECCCLPPVVLQA